MNELTVTVTATDSGGQTATVTAGAMVGDPFPNAWPGHAVLLAGAQ